MGLFRLAATDTVGSPLSTARLGSYAPTITVLLNGVDHSHDTRVSRITITDELNHAPNTASFRVDGFTPVVGQDVEIYLGAQDLEHEIFGGVVLSVQQLYEGRPVNVAWDCQCVDYTWLLNRRPVITKYLSTSATTILQDLVSTWSAGFTSTHVATGLASLDEMTLTNEDLATAITRVMDRVGGYWFVDYARDVHAFVTDTEAAIPITDAVPRTMVGITQATDLSQVATRVTARGGGANASIDVAAGSTLLRIDDPVWYASAGGTVETGAQRITYTGASSVATAAPGSAPTLVASTTGSTSSAASGVNVGDTLTFAYTYSAVPSAAPRAVWLDYESNLSPTATIVATALGAGVAEIDVSGIYATDPDIRSVKIWGKINAGAWQLLALGIFTFANVPGGGAWTQVNLGFSVTSQVLLPALTLWPALTGIPTSGAGSIQYVVPKGEPVNIVVTANDPAAQTALAALEGGDGIHEMFLTDGRWSLTEAMARATAELAQRKDPLVTVTFTSRDPTLQSGRAITLTITTPAISGTYKIQRVVLSSIGLSASAFPVRTVEASSRRYSFEDLLRQIRSVVG